MNLRTLRTAAAIAAAGGLLACSGDGGAPTTPEPEPVPGVLTLHLTTPHTDDGALLLTLTGPGPITGVALPAGSPHLLHSRGSGGSVRIAVFGAAASGELLRFSVPDVNRAAGYAAQLVEVADRASALRESTSGYTLRIER